MKLKQALIAWFVAYVAMDQMLAYTLRQPDEILLDDVDEINCSDQRCCQTSECISAAGRIIQAIDQKVDPCDNFYQFACGRWIDNQLLPPHRYFVSLYDNLDTNLAVARNLLNEKPKETDLPAIRKTKNLYLSCVMHSNKDREVESLIKVIAKTFGDWPISKRKWDKNKYDLENYLLKAIKFGTHPLIQLQVRGRLSVFEDGKFNLSNALELSEPTLGLPNELYSTKNKNSVLFSAYEEKLLSDARRFGTVKKERALKAIKNIIRVEQTLAQMLGSNDGENVTELTLAQLQQQFGQLINWTHFITCIAASPEIGITDITGEEIIQITNVHYLRNMVDYFSKLPHRLQANYIVWRVLDSLENIVLRGYRKEQAAVIQAVHGIKSEIRLEESCIKYVSRAMELVVHRLLYTRKLPQDDLNMINTLFKKIQEEFGKLLEEQDWVDEATALVIREKSAVLMTRLVFFQYSMNDSFVENYYSNVSFTRTDFVQNMLMERKDTFFRNMRLLRKPYEFDVEQMPFESVAMISMYENIIDMSANSFDPPTFSSNIPQSLNFGGIGFIFGHEFIHAFDNGGFRHDKHGREGNWWSAATTSKFRERYQCLIDQYSNFFYEEAQRYLNGTSTLAENIADNGGLKLAYRAYRRYVHEKGIEELPLPGLPYTSNQLFFINAAQVWCTRFAIDAVDASTTYIHSPPNLRVIGSMQNFDSFAEAFQCPVDSPMNPSKKCSVW